MEKKKAKRKCRLNLKSWKRKRLLKRKKITNIERVGEKVRRQKMQRWEKEEGAEEKIRQRVNEGKNKIEPEERRRRGKKQRGKEDST